MENDDKCDMKRKRSRSTEHRSRSRCTGLNRYNSYDSVTPPYNTADVTQAVDEATVAREAKRLYISDFPLRITEEEVTDFINQQMHLRGLAQTAENPVIMTHINWEKNFGFIEFKSIEETLSGMALHGIQFGGQNLKIGRSLNYQVMPEMHDIASSGVTENPQKIFIGGLPEQLDEDQLEVLLTPFGELRDINLVRNASTGRSRCFAFAEYSDVTMADRAIEGLHGKQFGGKILTAHYARACVTHKTQITISIHIPQIRLAAAQEPPSTVLCLMNMVVPDELKDDEKYGHILEYIKEEFKKYGVLKSIVIPRPIEGIDVPGCGKVFIEFVSSLDCQKAQRTLIGSIFNNRVVNARYFDQDRYHRREF